MRACTSDRGGEKKTEGRSFLSLEEAGLVEISGLSSHERFLCRLTVRFLLSIKFEKKRKKKRMHAILSIDSCIMA